jgi:hypothetical protein
MIRAMDPHGHAFIAAASLAPGAGAAGMPFPDHLIRPGIGAGGVRLGMSEGQVLRVLGRPDHRIATRDDLGAFVRLTWAGIGVIRWDGPGGRVIEITVTDRGIRMANGVGVGTPLLQARRALYPATFGSAPTVCTIGEVVPGGAITTLRFNGWGSATEVTVGRVIDGADFG